MSLLCPPAVVPVAPVVPTGRKFRLYWSILTDR